MSFDEFTTCNVRIDGAIAYWLYQATSKTPALKRFKAADEGGLQNDMDNQRNWNDLALSVQDIN